MKFPHHIVKYLALILLALCVCVIAYLTIGSAPRSRIQTAGVTFSAPYAHELGLSATTTLQTALTDIGIRHFRIPAYWSDIEPAKGEWHFAELDSFIQMIGAKQGTVTLAIGKKLPRWPECWTPGWAKSLSQNDQRDAIRSYIKTVMDRYKSNPTVTSWQIENEAHFVYGDCPAPDNAFLAEEIAYARSIDATRPIATTDSGELSIWVTTGRYVDELGVSVYRLVRNPLFGNDNLTYWMIRPIYYARKATLLNPFGVRNVYVSEFQMEPWSNASLSVTPIEDQLTSMNIDQMKNNFDFASRMGLSRVDFWGVEWWIWMKQHGHPEFVEEAARFWKSLAS